MKWWLALLLVLSGTWASAQGIELRDDRGALHRLVAPPVRVVSLLPSLTETVCSLGACAQLVGTDRYSNWPAAVLLLPKLGGLEDANVERIVALKPDVVLAAKSARVIERLESLGLRVVVLESQTHADVKRSVDLIAKLLGRPADAVRLWAQIDQDVARAAAMVPPALRGQRVYFEVASAPYAAGEASFIGETLTRLGMRNAVPKALGPFPKLNPEFVVRAKPDVVMAERRAVDEMPSRPGWQGIAALHGRSCGFESSRYETLIRPGPRMGEAALLMAECLQGLETPK
ncbi:ABC transporter substrate-binding protein [Piscinibacter terrae]|uniref:ABC transporter substrate-binding protein n=1 Tax=Piscinibacter terrae TaxID=2496871 RepID=A0A3N7HW30_9BURK|nr:helical backbone metal receptor [Albitalea terrae]RQP26534.1 ABC transporter substrate-binding protein [Albitalea terrae]